MLGSRPLRAWSPPFSAEGTGPGGHCCNAFARCCQEAGGPLGTLCAVSSLWGLAGAAFYTGRLGYFGAVSPSRGWEQQTHSISFPPITVTTLVCPGVGWTNGQRGWYFWPVLFLLEVEVGWPNLPSLPGAVPVLKVEVPHPRPPSLFTLEQWFRGNFHPQGH